MGLTFASIGVAHIVGGAVGVIMWVGGGSIYSNEFAPVHLQKQCGERRQDADSTDITELQDKKTDNVFVISHIINDITINIYYSMIMMVPFPMFLSSPGSLYA